MLADVARLRQRPLLARTTGYHESGSEAVSHGDDGVQYLLFAGELDRDGQFDLILDTSDHYTLSRPTLFLSTVALDGAPLRDAAHHQATRCCAQRPQSDQGAENPIPREPLESTSPARVAAAIAPGISSLELLHVPSHRARRAPVRCRRPA